MAVRPIDANAMLNELRPVSFEAEHSAVLLSDVSKMMREWVERQPTLTPQNEPLTLDELRQMDGQPVYVVFRPDNSGDKPQFWALVSADKQHDEVYLLDSMGGAGSYDEIWANIEAIYRRPPEGEV